MGDEMDSKKRGLFGALFLAIVAMVFLSGYFCGKIRTSGNGKNSELQEVMDVLDKYYYKDVTEEELLNGALSGAAASVEDPYTYFFEYKHVDSESFVGVGLSTTDVSDGMLITSIYNDSPAEKAGLYVGDIIYGVGDLEYPKNSLTEIKEKISGDLGEKRTLKIKRGDRTFDVEVTLAIIYTPTVEGRMINEAGYIKINQFDEETPTLFKEKLKELEAKNMSKLIIDVRNNPGGLLTSVNSILREFLTGDEVYLYMEYVKEDKTDYYRPVLKEKKTYDIDILINERSASASEVFALAMNRVMNYDLIGKTTFGKGVHQADYEMQSVENTYLHITLGYWYGPDMESVQGKGIDPTYEVDLPDYYSVMPPIDETYEIDMADNEIKNIQMMLKALGYDVRTDGYFDDLTKTILEENYESSKLTYEVMKEIFIDYNEEIKKDIHDTQLMRSLG